MRRVDGGGTPQLLASLALVLTGLAALAGGLTVAALGMLEWLDPLPSHRVAVQGVAWRPFDLLPFALGLCAIGSGGLFFFGSRLLTWSGLFALLAVNVSLALMVLSAPWSSNGMLGFAIVVLALPWLGRWVTLSGRYSALGRLPYLLGVAPLVIGLWMTAIQLGERGAWYRHWDDLQRLFAAQIVAVGLNWLVVWAVSWFGAPVVRDRLASDPPRIPSEAIQCAVRQVRRRGQRVARPGYRDYSLPSSAATASRRLA